MKEAFIKLHISIIIAGATGVFGKLITLNEGLLVWWRMMFATLILAGILYFAKKLPKLPLKEILKTSGVGVLLEVSKPPMFLSGWFVSQWWVSLRLFWSH